MSPSSATTSILAARPVLSGVRRAGEALGLARHELLHAGPPLLDPTRPPAVLLSSAVMASLHEGWFSNEADAEAAIRAGRVRLSPAQDRACVAPLAFVVSLSTPLFEVGDASAPSRDVPMDARSPNVRSVSIYSPVSTVHGPDLRMGFRDPALLARLADRDQRIVPLWQRALAASGPMALLPIAAHALAAGDDLHSRTTAATALLARSLRERSEFEELAAALDATPLFFLTIWMAASSLLLRATEGADIPTLVTRAGGNGERFGIALAGAPTVWTCAPATPPRGRRLPSAAPDAGASAAIGDSAVVDMLGCGGQTLARAEEPREALAGFLPDDLGGLSRRLLTCHHPQLDRLVGVDAERVRSAQAAPLVVLAMQHADGLGGFLGRGVYRPPVSLFEHALPRA